MSFCPKKDRQSSIVTETPATKDSSSFSSASPSLTPTSTSPVPGVLRTDQPAEFKPTTFVRDPSWRLLDWSVKPLLGKPGVELRASSWAAPGKHAFIRVEEQVQRDASGKIKVLHIKEMVGDQIIVKLPEGSTQENAEAMAAKIGLRPDPVLSPQIRGFLNWTRNLKPCLKAWKTSSQPALSSITPNRI